ncbi:major facilitator transporter [Reticulomyxa filosa]|uniref:Major facilitator transporter n=1 Tax=Reticulomyxa filosa TaxID=46433 RepID=X6NUV2_RETFI|nr:major facilitator transporter [Reticulomyxa filosa]|eukprot:ETO30085.1 major facilitator transporter [Reticulomyxa filosa]
MVGGLLLDKQKSRVTTGLPDHYYLEPTVKLLAWLSLLAFPFAFIVFVIDSIILFIFCAFAAMFLIFASTGPCNNAILWSVLYKDRPLAMAFNTFSIHALGDALAPVLVGFIIQTRHHAGYSKKEAYNFAMAIACTWLLLSTLCFFFARFFLNKLYRDLESLDENLKKQEAGYFLILVKPFLSCCVLFFFFFDLCDTVLLLFLKQHHKYNQSSLYFVNITILANNPFSALFLFFYVAFSRGKKKRVLNATNYVL